MAMANMNLIGVFVIKLWPVQALACGGGDGGGATQCIMPPKFSNFADIIMKMFFLSIQKSCFVIFIIDIHPNYHSSKKNQIYFKTSQYAILLYLCQITHFFGTFYLQIAMTSVWLIYSWPVPGSMWYKVLLFALFLVLLFILSRLREAIAYYEGGYLASRLLDPVSLSARKLKLLLDQRGVSYAGIIEKTELNNLVETTGIW